MLCGSKSFGNVGVYLARFLALQYAKQHGDYSRQNLDQHLVLVTYVLRARLAEVFMEMCTK
jgi:hypothetical protein